MTPELIAIISVGVALGVFGFAGFRFLNKQLAEGLREVHAVSTGLNARLLSGSTESTLGSTESTPASTGSSSRPMNALTGSTTDLAESTTDLSASKPGMSAIEQRQARLEGLLDGLREALFARATD